MPGSYTRLDADTVVDESGNRLFFPISYPQNSEGTPVEAGNALRQPFEDNAPPWWVPGPGAQVPDATSVTAGGVAPGVVKPPTGLYGNVNAVGPMGGNAENPQEMAPRTNATATGLPGTEEVNRMLPQGMPAPAPAQPSQEEGSLPPTEQPGPAGIPRTIDDVYAQAAGLAGKKQAHADEASRLAQEEARIQAEGAKQRADEEAAFAKEWQKRTEDSAKRVQERWDDWQKRNEEASKAEVDPSRHWTKRGALGSVMTILGVMMGAMVQDKFGNKNAALDIVREQIAQDIAAQEGAIANKRRGLESEKDAIQAGTLAERQALEDRVTGVNLRLKSLDKALDARIAALKPGKVRSDYEQAKLLVEEELMNTGMKAYEVIHGDEQAKLARSHAAGMQARQIKAQQDKDKLDRTHDIGMEMLRQKGDLDKMGAAAAAKGVEAPLVVGGNKVSGLRYIGADGQARDGVPALNDKAAEKIQEVSVAKTKEYVALMAVRDALANASTSDLALGDVELQAAIRGAAMGVARSYGGPVTEADVDNAFEQLYGSKNVTGARGLLNKMKPGEISNVIDTNLRNIKTAAESELSNYTAEGFTPVFLPRDTRGKKDPPRSAEEGAVEFLGKMGTPDAEIKSDGRRKPNEPVTDAGRLLEKWSGREPVTNEAKVKEADQAIAAMLEQGYGPEEFDRFETALSKSGRDASKGEVIDNETREQIKVRIRLARARAAHNTQLADYESRAAKAKAAGNWAEFNKWSMRAQELRIK